MGIEINGGGGRPPQEAVEAATSRPQATAGKQSGISGAAKTGAGGSDDLQLSPKVSQLQALEAEISQLPVVDTQRVQDVQRTLATGSFQVEPARVADKMLRFEAGLDRAQ